MTYIELIERGFCEEVVFDFVRKTGIFQAEISPDFLHELKEKVNEKDWETLLCAVGLNGGGDGDGYGDGYGDGSGDGGGFVSGDGVYAYGYGFRSGDGLGFGFVDGDGDGDGNGEI